MPADDLPTVPATACPLGGASGPGNSGRCSRPATRRRAATLFHVPYGCSPLTQHSLMSRHLSRRGPIWPRGTSFASQT
jgi:hypothetical protein